MSPELRETLQKVALPLAVIVIPMIVAKVRGIDVRALLGLYKPPARTAVALVAVWIVWMVITEFLLAWLGIEQSRSSRNDPMLIAALRILAFGILGPIAEEILFRGALYSRVSPYIGAAATIIAMAAVWALLHLRYGWTWVAFIFVDGLFFGYARYRSGSVYPPMAMHIIGNLFAMYQSMR